MKKQSSEEKVARQRVITSSTRGYPGLDSTHFTNPPCTPRQAQQPLPIRIHPGLSLVLLGGHSNLTRNPSQ